MDVAFGVGTASVAQLNTLVHLIWNQVVIYFYKSPDLELKSKI